MNLLVVRCVCLSCVFLFVNLYLVFCLLWFCLLQLISKRVVSSSRKKKSAVDDNETDDDYPMTTTGNQQSYSADQTQVNQPQQVQDYVPAVRLKRLAIGQYQIIEQQQQQ